MGRIRKFVLGTMLGWDNPVYAPEEKSQKKRRLMAAGSFIGAFGATKTRSFFLSTAQFVTISYGDKWTRLTKTRRETMGVISSTGGGRFFLELSISMTDLS